MESQHKETKTRRTKMRRSVGLSIPMVLFMLYDFFPAQLPWTKQIMPWMAAISLLLTIPIQFGIGKTFLQGARSALRMKTANMFTLISIGTLVAFIYSIRHYAVFRYQTGSLLGLDGEKIIGIYFEVAGLLITFVTIGKYLEAKAK